MWERTYRAWKGKGIQFVGIGLLDTREASLGFVKKHGLTFPNGYDGNGRVATLYGFTYQPFWARINKAGLLLKAGYGPSSEDELLSAVRSLVGR